MKTKLYIPVLSLLLLLWSTELFSQTATLEKIITPVGFDISQKLSDIPPITPGYLDQTWKEKVIPNKEGFLEEFNTEATWKGPDPVLQSSIVKAAAASVVLGPNFSGLSNTSGVAPPDTQGDVGPNHYFQMVNLSFQIWNKSGTSLYGPALSSTLWSGFTGPWTGTNNGDPIVLYDQAADRWIATQFSLPNYPSGPFYELVAISQTPDPTGAWYRYAFEFINMPDYPKFGVWPDGYYLTVNQFKSGSLGFVGAAVCVLERSLMLSGNSSARMLFFNLGIAYGSLLPADVDGSIQPAAGKPNYLANLGTNSLRIWEAKINWTTTSLSSVSLVKTLTTQSYSYSGITINQPGTSQTLDPLASRLMYRLQYRNFGTYEVMLTNHSVNANGTGRAGVRWYELRNYGSGWTIHQQGTFAPADGTNRWMGSVAMNGSGDIGIGYSVSGTGTYPSIRFAGQSAANSGTGLLDVSETSIQAGSASQTGVNRWGDYSMMSVDPSNDKTFWYTNEYSNGGWNWLTKIASFTFETAAPGPPVANFSGTPTTVVVGGSVQFTDLSANTPTSWSWTFTGGTPSTSNAQNPLVTYNTAGTYTVSLAVSNASGSDTKTVTNYITVNTGGGTTTYCASHSNISSLDYIKNVAVSVFSNPSGASTYSDFTNLTIGLAPGNSNSVVLTPNSTTRREYWRIWIDFNADGDFIDAGELVFSANNKKGIVSGSMVIPSTASGQTRMRVSMKYGGAPTSCEVFTYGEVEDYTVSFGNAPAITAIVQDFNLELYPNPARDLLNVQLSGSIEKANIKIYNALGMIIDDFDVDKNTLTVNISNYARGIYYIGADNGSKTTLKKFIKD